MKIVSSLAVALLALAGFAENIKLGTSAMARTEGNSDDIAIGNGALAYASNVVGTVAIGRNEMRGQSYNSHTTSINGEQIWFSQPANAFSLNPIKNDAFTNSPIWYKDGALHLNADDIYFKDNSQSTLYTQVVEGPTVGGYHPYVQTIEIQTNIVVAITNGDAQTKYAYEGIKVSSITATMTLNAYGSVSDMMTAWKSAQVHITVSGKHIYGYNYPSQRYEEYDLNEEYTAVKNNIDNSYIGHLYVGGEIRRISPTSGHLNLYSYKNTTFDDDKIVCGMKAGWINSPSLDIGSVTFAVPPPDKIPEIVFRTVGIKREVHNEPQPKYEWDDVHFVSSDGVRKAIDEVDNVKVCEGFTRKNLYYRDKYFSSARRTYIHGVIYILADKSAGCVTNKYKMLCPRRVVFVTGTTGMTR